MRSRVKRKRGIVFWAGLLGCGWIAGVSGGEPGPVDLELVSEVNSIRPGSTFTVGLSIRHGAGWHTYWKNPGIVGVATSIEWDLPPGFSAGPIQWPEPQVVKMGVVGAYGYEGETLLLVDIHPPDAIELSGDRRDVVLKARVVFMACATTCHPGFLDLELALPVAVDGADSKEPDWNARWHAVFEDTRRLIPRRIPGWSSIARRRGDNILLEVRPLKQGAAPPGAVYFFSSDDQVDSDAPQRVRFLDGGGFVVEMRRAFYGPEDAGSLPGVLFSPEGWLGDGRARSMIIDAPLEKSG